MDPGDSAKTENSEDGFAGYKSGNNGTVRPKWRVLSAALFSLPILTFDGDVSRSEGHRIHVNLFDQKRTLEVVAERIEKGNGFALATINLDHMVKLALDKAFLAAYQKHEIIVPDGFPIVWLSRLSGQPAERTTGADLVQPVMKLLEQRGKSVAFLGTTQEVLDKVKELVSEMYPKLSVVYAYSPPFGFSPDSKEAAKAIQAIEESGASICFLAFGAPKQELLAARGAESGSRVGYISIGGALDFIAGHQVRAPEWVQRACLEWFWRLAHNPKRLLWRYTQCAIVFPVLLVRAFWQTRPKNVEVDARA